MSNYEISEWDICDEHETVHLKGDPCPFCSKTQRLNSRIAELEATLQRVRECKQYVAELPEIGKLAPVLRWRDVLQALGEAK